MPRDDEGNYLGYGEIAAGMLAGTVGLTRRGKRTAAAALGGGSAAVYSATKMLKAEEKKIVKKAVKATNELKNLDAVLAYTFGTAYQTVLLNGIQDGTAGTNKTGRHVVIENVYLDFDIALPGTAANDDCRVMLVWDKECRGAQYAAADLFAQTGAGTIARSVLNFDNTSRFHVIMDRNFCVNNTTVNPGATAYGVSVVGFKHKYKVNKKVDYYTGVSGGTITSIDAGALTLVLVSTAGVAIIGGTARVTFRDL